MLYGTNGDTPHPLYERALRSHRLHNERWNYPMHVLRQEIAGGYWNKPSYLLSLVVAELAKPPAERLEWLMWVDADLIIINPAIPLELFLPPSDFRDTHFLGNKDHVGLNTGTFFLHIDPWSVRMLAKAIALPLFAPDLDLGVSADQQSMAYIFNETETAGHCEVMYQPRVWYNTYEWRHAYEGSKGNLLVHFPGLDDERWAHMGKWLDIIERTPQAWELDLKKTMYGEEVSDFWGAAREARATLRNGYQWFAEQDAWRGIRPAIENEQTIRQACDELAFLLMHETDRPKRLKEKTSEVKHWLELSKTETRDEDEAADVEHDV